MKTYKITVKAACLFFVISFASVFVTNAQYHDFKLTDYKNPDYQWRKLNVSFGLSGSNTNNKMDGDSFEYASKNDQSNYGGSLNLDYYSVTNLRKYQGEQFGNLNTNAQWYKNMDKDFNKRTSKKNNQHLDFNYRINNRFYFNKLWFVEADLTAGYSKDNGYYKNTGNENYPVHDKTITNNINVSVGVPLMIGYGRIEDAQDARLAVYILEDLEKAGRLSHSPTHEEILSFASFITQTKNKRYFDIRLKKIEELTVVDSFLVEKQLIKKQDIQYFTLLNDNWDYAMSQERSSGYRVSVGFQPYYSYSFNDEKAYYTDMISGYPPSFLKWTEGAKVKTNDYNYNIVAQFIHEKPINLYWQSSAEASLTYLIGNSNNSFDIHSHDDTYKCDTVSPGIKAGLAYAIHYYPNTRTSLRMGVNASYLKAWGHYEFNDYRTDIDNQRLNAGLSFSCNYYFSPRLRLNAGLNGNYDYTLTYNDYDLTTSAKEKQTTNNFHTSFFAGLVYMIF